MPEQKRRSTRLADMLVAPFVAPFDAIERGFGLERNSSRNTSTKNVYEYSSKRQSNKDSRKRGKRVRFNKSPPKVIPSNEHVGANELWYPATDLLKFRSTNNIIVQGLVKSKPDYQKAIKDTFRACEHATEYTGQLNPELWSDLRLHLNEETNGLEVLSVETQEHAEHRRSKLLRLVQHHRFYHKDPEETRKLCEQVSLPNRLFARHIALAQGANIAYVPESLLWHRV